MDTKAMTEIMAAVIQTKVYLLIAHFIIAGVILLLLKSISEAICGYILFRSDKHICIGSPVEINGKQGRLVSASLFTITIETECGFIRVPTKDWRSSGYIILKDSMVLRKRRVSDKSNQNGG